MTRVLLVGVTVAVACAPMRPRAGNRTLLIDIPFTGATGDGHLRPEHCQPCLRERLPDETLLSCSRSSESVGISPHWDIMACFFEGP